MDEPRRLAAFRLAALVVSLAGLAGVAFAPAAAQPRFTAHRPIVITACGQPVDARTVSQLSAGFHLDHRFDPGVVATKLTGVRTLVVVVGGSVSGLAGGSVDEDREWSRVRDLLARARRTGVRVIAVHVGGESRRGPASDRLIGGVIHLADYLIVTEAGNRDGLFTRAAKGRGVPLVIVSEPADVVRELLAVVAPD